MEAEGNNRAPFFDEIFEKRGSFYALDLINRVLFELPICSYLVKM